MIKSLLKISLLLVVITTFSSCCGLRLHSEKVAGKPSPDVWFPNNKFNIDSIQSLTMNSDKEFKILLLADIQLDGNPFRKKKAFKLITKLVDSTKPDFIATLGDNSEWIFSDAGAKKVTRFLDKFNIPYAVVLGNHDAEGRKARAYIGNIFEKGKNSMFKYGPSNIHGVGNYPVLLKDDKGNIVYAFIFMDSNAGREFKDGNGYDFIHKDQINWYKWNIKKISKAQYGKYDPENGKVVPSMTFFHIPLLEFNDAIKAYKEGKIDTTKVVKGAVNEGVASSKVNSGFFKVMKQMKSTTDIFNGHDHVNNISIPYEGIRFTYGLKSAPTSYYNENQQGGTLVTIKENKNGKPDVKIKFIYINKEDLKKKNK